MKHRILFLLFIIGMFTTTAWAQNGSIKGKVLDAQNGTILPSATVLLHRDKVALDVKAPPLTGKVADHNGEFEFPSVEPGVYTVIVSYTSHKKSLANALVEAGKTVELTISLTPDIKGLEEIVVTGVASRTQKSVAEVAVSRVNATDYTDANGYQDVSQLLTGKVAGVTVSPSSGNVGGGIRFNVRSGAGLFGSGQPVIFIDGVRANNIETIGFEVGGQGVSALADINPQDIESIEILKGPAASALYGTSGSNGVVLIRTKSGARQQQSGAYGITYRTTQGWNEQGREYTKDMFLSYQDANDVHRRGPINENFISVSGNSGYFNYYTSFENRGEKGILVNNDLNRSSLRANFEAYPSDVMTFKVNTSFIFNKISRPQNDNSILGPLAETMTFGPATVKTADGRDSTYSRSFPDITHEASDAISNVVKSQRFIGSFEANITPVTNLLLRGVIGYDGTNLRNDADFPRNQVYPGTINGQRHILTSTDNRYNFDLGAAYAYDLFEKFRTNTIIGSQGFIRSASDLNVSKENFPSTLVTNLGAGSKFLSADETTDNFREAGIFFQEETSYDNTYFFSFGVRNDYASSVGPEAPSIFYPRASAAVRLDRLGFLPENLNLVKLRAAYGESGILPGSFDASGLRWTGTAFGAGTGAVIEFIGNPDIVPERIREFEIGLETEFLNNYGLEFTYYRQFAKNSIVSFRDAPSTGLTASSIPRNVGEIKGWGYEANLYGSPVRGENYQLDLNFIWNYAQNEVVDIGGSAPIYDSYNINAIAVGLPRSSFYMNTVKGAHFGADGRYDGAIVDTGKSNLGTPTPVHSGSFSMTFRFLKDFTLYAQTDWALGHSIFNQIKQYLNAPFYENNEEVLRLVTQLGIAEDLGATPVPGVDTLTRGTQAYADAADRYAHIDYHYPANFVYAADFLRLREVSLRVNLLDLLGNPFEGKYIRGIDLIFSARNVWMTTKYIFVDPEVNLDGARSLSRGQDFGTLQNPRVYNFMLSLGF